MIVALIHTLLHSCFLLSFYFSFFQEGLREISSDSMGIVSDPAGCLSLHEKRESILSIHMGGMEFEFS